MLNLFNWLLAITDTCATFFTWLTTTIPGINLSALDMLGFAGIVTLITIHVAHLISIFG